MVDNDDIFKKLITSISYIDPVLWAENTLTLDGKPFRLIETGYKPIVDILRYICIKALDKSSKPIVWVKGRQVAGTTTAGVASMFMMASGMFGNTYNPPIRVGHLWPTIDRSTSYSKTKLSAFIDSSVLVEDNNGKKGKKPIIRTLIDTSSSTNDNIGFKQFVGGNHIWIESVGLDGSRMRGKQLCLETELPTPNGFIKLADLKEGQELFDENGNICNVIKIYPIQNSPEAYRITFDDDTIVDACADHLWLTYTKSNRVNNTKPTIKTSKEIFETLKVGKAQESNHSIPCTMPINYGKKSLPIDPYLFGTWLGNDKNNIIKNNLFIQNNSNKNIPQVYLQSSFEQRLNLLQGLMDVGGNCSKNRMTFNSINKDLIIQVKELISSFGIKSKIYNKKYKDKYCIYFTTDLPVFRSEKKIATINIEKKNKGKSKHRYIKNVVRIDSKPMKCIKVNSPSELFLITRSFIPTHNTCDVLLFDECQEMPGTAIANSTKVLTKSQYGALGEGVQMYFGTPLQRGSEFWKMWDSSSQQYYHLGCEKCQNLFPLYTPGSNEWESIWLYDNTVKCTHCEYEQDRLEAINRGKWVATKNVEEAKFIGFHLNQLYLPEFTKEKIISSKPENSVVNTERTYQNEILGEFFQGESSILTPEEIRTICGDVGRKIQRQALPDEDVISFLGIDIGAKADLEQLANSDKVKAQGKSYSTAVVLSISGAHKLSIDCAFKFKRNDLESKKDVINETIKRYKCNLTVCDIGYAHDFNEIMQTEHGERFLASMSTGKLLEKVKYNSDVFPKVIAFEREFWITELYSQMRKGLIRFPLGSYDQVAWLIQHCCNMEIKPSVSRTGEVSPHYVKSGPNDGFMALLNAYLAYKFYISKGFTIKNPLLQNNITQKPKPSVIAVHSPRRAYNNI